VLTFSLDKSIIIVEITREAIPMINIRTILKLKENDGLTLKNGKSIVYKSGWQVATEGIETTSAREAINAVKAYNGNCGVWYSNGIYYIDKSHRVNTKHEALEVGRAHNQISVLGWKNMALAYC
jgi:vacuolar-type H+-ATPase subunit C/Vma6